MIDVMGQNVCQLNWSRSGRLSDEYSHMYLVPLRSIVNAG